MNIVKILVTGGHLTPAISVIDAMKKDHPDWKIIFVGRNKAQEGINTEAEEEKTVKSRNIPFIRLTAGRLRGHIELNSIISLLKIPVGLIQAVTICLKEKPALIVSFGGYVALPVVIAGYITGIPSVTHEQTLKPGLANRIISIFAAKICVSQKSVKKYFPAQKTVWTGIPLRESIYNPPERNEMEITDLRPIIYITGGATGSRSVNNLVYPIISKLIRKYMVVHQVGRTWISEAGKVRQSLRGDRRKYYKYYPYIDEKNHAWILYHSGLVISRAGANTVGELEYLKTPSILLPLPWSRGNEQLLNAEYLEKSGLSVCLDQNKISPDDLLNIVTNKIRTGPFTRKIQRLAGKDRPAYRILHEIEQLINIPPSTA
jgi:UDP-N-acetylglucosamine--N-acetylmuramyl-(pentapeptide) pyrophosphoryl-undecaprenol N-acetylglucosamine transferase